MRSAGGSEVKLDFMKIAVMLAHNWANTGMYSVDLSAFRLFESLGFSVDYFVASGGRTNSLFKSGQVPIYRISDAGALSAYDSIVYWGDFTTSPYYALNDFLSQMNSYDGPVSNNDAFKAWVQMFLLSDRHVPGQRLFSFAQNFQTLGTVANKVSLPKMAPLYERFTSIMPRDSISKRELHAHLPSLPANVITQGCDAAFLLRDDCTAVVQKKPKQISLFFERTRVDNRADLIADIRRRGYEPTALSQWLSLPRNRFHENFLDMCNTIRESSCVITDTYHLAVNAIRMGVTPIVLGADDVAQTTTVSDFKKRVMLRDLDAEDLYSTVHNAMLPSEQIREIGDKVDAIAQAQAPHPVHEHARQAAEAALLAFKSALIG